MREQDKQQKKEQEQKGENKHREEKEGIQNEIASRVIAPPQTRPNRNKYHWVVKVSSQKLEGSEVKKDHGEIKVRDQKQELKIKEDCRRVKTRRKPRAEEDMTGGTVQQVSRNGSEVRFPGWVSEERFPGRVNQMARMYWGMENLSMNPKKIGGSRTTYVSGHQWSPAFSRRSGHQKTTGAGLIWVRKEKAQEVLPARVKVI